MLKFIFTDVNDEQIEFPAPLSLTIQMDEDVPADDLYAVFPLVETAELKLVTVCDTDQIVFVGVVDEEDRQLNESGGYLKISARTLAAHLLDNEAQPTLYDHPSASLIYERHVSPYGIAWDEDDATCFGEQSVTKGMSQWMALKNFCLACYSAFPRITADGRLYMKGRSSQVTRVYSDRGFGVRYTDICERRTRCSEISRVNVKTANTGGYTLRVENEDALSRGVRRERYLNAMLTQTPMKCADAIIASGAASSYSLTLTCPSRQLCSPGDRASVRSAALGERSDLYVSSLRYHADESGEQTQIKLKRRKS